METDEAERGRERDSIFKVCARSEWERACAEGVYRGSAVDVRDGFIHFSTVAQLGETLRRHFAGQTDLVRVEVRAAALGQELRWEPSRGGDLFPHLYGDLPTALAVAVSAVGERDAEGSLTRRCEAG